MQVITSFDYFLFPIYIVFGFIILWIFRKRLNPDPTNNRLYYMAFFVRILGAFFFSILYQYYYGYGDSLMYFNEARILHQHIMENPSNIHYLFSSIEEYRKLYDPAINSTIPEFYNANTLLTIRITTVFTFLSGNTYLTTSVFFALVSFTGVWLIFSIFISIAPKQKRQLAWGILFFPTLIFWSSGIMKDSLCIAAIGWMFYCLYKFFIHKRRKIIYLIAIILSALILLIIKSYILIAFLITIGLVILFKLYKKVKSLVLRITVIISLIIIIVSIFSTNNWISSSFENINVDMMIQEISQLQTNYESSSISDDSNFKFGEINPTIGGLLEKLPFAITTVLYRPFLWECKKLIMFLSGLENIIMMILTIYVIIKSGFKIFRIIIDNSLIQFCLIFTIVLAAMIGFTTFNFGTMIRYKTPLLPFYSGFLILLYYYGAKFRTVHANLIITK